MSTRSRSALPRRLDLDTTVNISPDEAGIFDLALFEGAPEDGPTERSRENALDEMSIVLSTGVHCDIDVLEAEYKHVGRDRYQAEVIGIPVDSATVSRWAVTFVVKS